MGESNQAVFLSYASQDADAARRICAALRAAGVEVWFDQSELRGGDAWDQKIRRQIKECALFVPVISANTQARGEGYFRLEWKLAADRSHLMARDQTFILPIAIDGTSNAVARVPDEFLSVQWMRLPEGNADSAFTRRVQAVLGDSSPLVSATYPFPAAPGRAARGGPSRWLIVAGATAALFAAYLFIPFRPAGTETAAGSKSGMAPAAQPAREVPAQVSSIPPVANDKTIAVLPLANLSPDRENEFFADGIHEDVLTSLQNIPELRVVSRTSVLEYRTTTKKIPQIGRELGVAYVVAGSVRRAGNEVKISGQLIRAATDEQIWARSFHRELTPKNMFEIQATLATEIAGALRAAISPETRKLLERRPTENLAAYDLYVKGRASDNGSSTILTQSTILARRLELYRGAVELDPNFAEAWGELATAHGQHVMWNVDRSPHRIAQAEAAIAQAVRLAPDAPEVMRHIGMYAYFVHRDYARALVQFEKVIQLQPNNALAVFFIAAVQRRQGRWLDSISTMRKAMALDAQHPLYPRQLANLMKLGRRWDELTDWYRQQIAITPNSSRLQIELARTSFLARGSTLQAEHALAQLGVADEEAANRWIEAKYWAAAKGDLAEWMRLDAAQPDDPIELRGQRAIAAARVLAARGNWAGARARIGQLPAELRRRLETDPQNTRHFNELALMEAFLGARDEAVRLARKAVQLLPESIDALNGPDQARVLAEVYALTGDKDSALREYARLLREPGSELNVHEMRRFPEFAPLRGDSRFEALLTDPKNNAPLF